MPNLNQVFLMGNLTRDPELRVTPRGTAICLFSLAINHKWRDPQGAEREEVTFVDVEAWAKAGETIAKYCAKGRPLFVAGRLRLDTWEDKTTKEKRSRMKVVCEGFQFLGAPPVASHPSAAVPLPPSAPQKPLDEDVPF